MKNLVHTPVTEYMTRDYLSRFHSGTADEKGCTHENALKVVNRWKNEGAFVVANAGAFDLLGLNHIRGLIQCRVIGAMCLLGLDDIIEDKKTASHVFDVAASNRIKLLVSIDTNKAVEDNKSRTENNGGAIKPILDWSTRAMMVASQSMPIPYSDLRRPSVDYITRHGPESCAEHGDDMCWHEDSAFSIASILPDLLVLKNSSEIGSTLDKYSVGVVQIDEHYDAFTDPLLDDQVSSSATIRRIRTK